MKYFIITKTILVFILVSAVVVGGWYFFLPANAALRDNIERLLDFDVLYFKNGDVVRGWIWDEKEGVIVGETEEGEIFNYHRLECQSIQRNIPLYYFRNLI